MVNILVVEDEEVLRTLMVEELKKHGYNVRSAVDGQEGWKLIEEDKPDLILLDLLMPIVNGYEILTRLSQNSYDTPCIVLSNSGQIDDLNRAFDLGAKDVLVKANFTPEQLVQKVTSLLEKK